jgi:hypothetical protein
MKKGIITALLMLAICLLACTSALADDAVTTDGLYSYQLNGKNAILTGYLGSDTELTLPTEADGHPVTEIASLFMMNSDVKYSLSALTIPEGYVKIGICAFSGCPIARLSLPSTLREICGVAFEKCALEVISLPEGLEILDDAAFFQCPLKTAALPDSLTTLGANPFADCKSLTQLTISPTNTNWKITDGVVFSADGKTLIIYPAGLQAESYTVPEGVTDIGGGAFRGAALKSVALPKTALRIKMRAFQDCTSLERVDLPESLVSIWETAFYNCKALYEITLPDHLNYIGGSAFAGCSSLTAMELPDSLTDIGDRVFQDGPNLVLRVSPGTAAEAYVLALNLAYEYKKDTMP